MQETIDANRAAWSVSQLGARTEYRFAAPAPRTGSESAAATDDELDEYLHLYLANRGVLITPFHNMALMCPDTTGRGRRRCTRGCSPTPSASWSGTPPPWRCEATVPHTSTDAGGEHLPGNVGGAWRVGDTVHRATGPWTPAVHALLAYLDGRVPHVPRVLGTDDEGREVLTYLPGRVVDVDTEELTEPQVVAVATWARCFHDAAAGFAHPGPWRFPPLADELVGDDRWSDVIVGHNDVAPYNVCFEGGLLAGVFDWDLAGPTTRLMELAFMAWNCVPLWRPMDAGRAAHRLRVLTQAYGDVDPAQVLDAVPVRIGAMVEQIPLAAARGDRGMQHLMTRGEPQRSRESLAGLVTRTPAIRAHLR